MTESPVTGTVVFPSRSPNDTAPVADRLWVNKERTVFVRQWASGTVEVATREQPWHTWGPPVVCEEEK